MRSVTLIVVLMALATASTRAQAPASQPTTAPRFEVVSVKPNAGPGTSMSMMQRPDGGFTMINMQVRTLITQAYGPVADIIGLPGWAANNRYDVNATASLPRPATQDDRRTMMQAMLADRFKLAVHMETREQPAYNLVFARSDRRLGRNATPSAVDCEAKAAAERAAAAAARAAGAAPALPTLPPRPDPNAPPPECSFRSSGGTNERRSFASGTRDDAADGRRSASVRQDRLFRHSQVHPGIRPRDNRAARRDAIIRCAIDFQRAARSARLQT